MAQDFDNDSLVFAHLLLKAEVLSLLSILDEVCQQVGYRDPDSLSIFERFYRQRRDELEKVFRSLEDTFPGLAARLHERYEAARESLGEDHS